MYLRRRSTGRCSRVRLRVHRTSTDPGGKRVLFSTRARAERPEVSAHALDPRVRRGSRMGEGERRGLRENPR